MIKPGIYDNISIQDYHSEPDYISATSIKEAKRSLKQFHWHRTGKMKREQKTHFDFGNAFELALLDRINFDNQVAILQTEYWIQLAQDEKKAEGKDALKVPKSSARYKAEESKFFAANEGKYIIPDVGEQSFEYIEHMLESCYSDPVIQKLISGTQYQLSLFWEDEESGLKLKTRPDICKVKKNVIVNLKTTDDASPEKFSRDLSNYNYPLQACVEIQGCLKTGLMPDVDVYLWLVVEKKPPFNAVIYEFTKNDIDICMGEYRYLINKIGDAYKQNKWPGYQDRSIGDHGILEARIPNYYFI